MFEAIELKKNEGRYGEREQYENWSGGADLWQRYAPELGGIFRALMGFSEERILDTNEAPLASEGLSHPMYGMLELVQANAENMALVLEQEAFMDAFMAMFGAPQKETLHLGSAQVFVHLRELAQQAEEWTDESAVRFQHLVSKLRAMVEQQLVLLEQERLAKEAELNQAALAKNDITSMKVTKASYVTEANTVLGVVSENSQILATGVAFVEKKLAQFGGFLDSLRSIEFVSLANQRRTGLVAA